LDGGNNPVSTNFPTTLDSFTNPLAGDKLNVVSHSAQHANANDAIAALEAKVGIDGSGVAASHDALLAALAAQVAAIRSAVWPIGSVFISVLSTDPATLLGFGTWSAIGAGRVLVGQNVADTDFDVLEETGGAKTVASAGSVAAPAFTGTQASLTHSGTAVADHAAHTHSVTSNVAVGDHAAHTHAVTSNVAVGNHTFTQPTISWPAGVPTHSGTAISDHAAHTHTVTAAGTNSAPAFTGSALSDTTKAASGSTSVALLASPKTPAGTVAAPTFTGSQVTSGNPSATLTHTVSNQGTIAWPAGVPTNASGAVDAHSVTNNAVTSGSPSATLSHTVTNNAVTSGNPSATLSHSVTQPDAHTYTPAGTVAAPAFTGSQTSVMPPYLVVKMWKRTA
jgi:hypothetical protein